jgi:hypothetical protein
MNLPAHVFFHVVHGFVDVLLSGQIVVSNAEADWPERLPSARGQGLA